jgi:hypothetical protein
VSYSALYGMVAYCVLTTLMLSMAGIKVVKGRFFHRASSSPEQQASVPTSVPTTVPTPVQTTGHAISGQEAGGPLSLIDLVPEQLAIQCQEQNLPVLRNPDRDSFSAHYEQPTASLQQSIRLQLTFSSSREALGHKEV